MCIRDRVKILRSLSTSDKLSIILSSATIPYPEDFASKITGVAKRHIMSLIYDQIWNELKKYYGISLKGSRLVIIEPLEMNPTYSWNTYVQLWTVMMCFVYYTYVRDRRYFKPQSIVFINNIKELRRAHSGFNENISLGEPRDHVSGTYGLRRSALDDYVYWHYCSKDTLKHVISVFNSGKRLEELVDLVQEMHSEVSLDSRASIVNSLRSGKNLAVILSTSSLELGVDYKNVSFILNIGFENPLILAQRIGRGGRSENTLRTVLGIVLSKNIPSETLTLYSAELEGLLNPAPTQNELNSIVKALPISSDNPQVIRRGYLTAAFSELARLGYDTYASRRPLRSKDLLIELLEKLNEILGNEHFRKKYEYIFE